MQNMYLMILIVSFSFGFEHVAAGTCYVKSSLMVSCPAFPCLTLHQYFKSTSPSYFSNDTLFVFLPGIHFLQIPFHLRGLTNISLVATGYLSATINVFEEIHLQNITGLAIADIEFALFHKENKDFSIVRFLHCINITITNVQFNANKIAKGRSIYSNNSIITIKNGNFNNNTGINGGALYITNHSSLTIQDSSFLMNKATNIGGAIYAHDSQLIISGKNENLFLSNIGSCGGGAIICDNCNITASGNNSFYSNKVLGCNLEGFGGAIAVENGNVEISGMATYDNNSAINGGAISLSKTDADFSKALVTFTYNIAVENGGGLYACRTSLKAERVVFIANSARCIHHSNEVCGALCLTNTSIDTKNSLSPTLINNTGFLGGAMFVTGGDGFALSSINAHDNTDGVVGILNATAKIYKTNTFSSNVGRGVFNIKRNSNCEFHRGEYYIRSNSGEAGAFSISKSSTVCFTRGIVEIINNTGYLGGGAMTAMDSHMEFTSVRNLTACHNEGKEGGVLYAIRSTIAFTGNTYFCHNTANTGGAVRSILGNLNLYSNAVFTNNTATYGGALHTSGSNIFLKDRITFMSNSAIRGGALYLELDAVMNLTDSVNLNTYNNTAFEYGGFIYHKDSVSNIQCTDIDKIFKDNRQALEISLAFLQLSKHATCPKLVSHGDYAKKDGSFLYGGLLDRSRLQYQYTSQTPYEFFFHSKCRIKITSGNRSEDNVVASEPFQLQICSGSEINNYTSALNVSVYRGQTFLLTIVATGQGNSLVPASIVARTSPTANLEISQNLQEIERVCSSLQFNVYSNLSSDYSSIEELRLYPIGPCHGTGVSSTLVYVHLKKCPPAFTQFDDRCACESRLTQHNIECIIKDHVSIIRSSSSTVWINATYAKDGTYKGLITYSPCPSQYCTKETINISLDNPDCQCAFKHSGVLCSRCITNHSLHLGNSQCGMCSNAYLNLIWVFAFAGVFLLMFLAILKLTVSNGTVNSFILYANVIQANKELFNLYNKTNLLTIFIAWINLDFGFNVCFFVGMTAYIQTWLQFAFPFYVWTLMCIVIITSRYSTSISKLFGTNPVTVLATLLLMSYNKLLKVIIDVFSYAELEYPDKKVKVWVKDGEVQYLNTKHIILVLFTLVILAFIFLPYTVFLLAGPWLYRLPDSRYCSLVLSRIKPLLDSYYAPYKLRTRYWTGILLIVRCILYAVFSSNSSGGNQYSLLAIMTAFSAIGAISWLNKGLYKLLYMDIIESSVYLNLIILAAATATLSGSILSHVTSCCLGIVFVTFVLVITYHIHIHYFIKSVYYHRVKCKIFKFIKVDDSKKRHKQVAATNSRSRSTADTTLREPLLELNN